MSVWAKTWAYGQHPRRIGEDGKPTDKKHPAAKAVLVALAEFPGPGQRACWPSQATLAEMTDFTDRQVRTCMADLEAQGLIEREERRRADGSRRSDRVTLLGPIEAFGPSQDADEPEESSGRTNRKRVPGGGEESSGHEPSVRTVKEPSSPKGSAKAEPTKDRITLLVDRCREMDFEPTPKQKLTWSNELNAKARKDLRGREFMRLVNLIAQAGADGYFWSFSRAEREIGKARGKTSIGPAQQKDEPEVSQAEKENPYDLRAYLDRKRRAS